MIQEREEVMTISVKVIADSVGEHAPRLTTLQLRYPKFIHGEFMTHRVFSRNASSSRAIPVERLIKDVVDDPVYPFFWGKNQSGMQAAEECGQRVFYPGWQNDFTNPSVDSFPTREEAWDCARQSAIAFARAYVEAGYHKQIVNRLLEPFCHINVVVTATEWSNFFALRCHPAAQPEMRLLAEAIRSAMSANKPTFLRAGDWHVPYARAEDQIDNTGNYAWDMAVKISVARCARVSYLTQDGKTPTVEEDLKLYDRLAGAVPLHASPCEHQATPDFRGTRADHEWFQPQLHGNLRGWVQYRKTLPGECQ